MLYFPLTKGYVSQEFPVATAASITAEGQALVSDLTSGVFGVKPSTGASGDAFLGVSISQQLSFLSLPKIEEGVQSTGNTFTLARTPVAGTLAVYDVTAGALITAGTGGWSLSGHTVTLQAGTASHVLHFIYRYSPTLFETRAIQGDIVPGGAPGLSISQVGVIRSGVVYTTEFDTTVNWQATTPTVKLAANGLFTIGGSGATVSAQVIAPPTPTLSYLGLLLKEA